MHHLNRCLASSKAAGRRRVHGTLVAIVKTIHSEAHVLVAGLVVRGVPGGSVARGGGRKCQRGSNALEGLRRQLTRVGILVVLGRRLDVREREGHGCLTYRPQMLRMNDHTVDSQEHAPVHVLSKLSDF